MNPEGETHLVLIVHISVRCHGKRGSSSQAHFPLNFSHIHRQQIEMPHYLFQYGDNGTRHFAYICYSTQQGVFAEINDIYTN